MNSLSTQKTSKKKIKISDRTRELYAKRNKALDNDPDAPSLTPDQWAKATTLEEYQRRTRKQQITVRVDPDNSRLAQFQRKRAFDAPERNSA